MHLSSPVFQAEPTGRLMRKWCMIFDEKRDTGEFETLFTRRDQPASIAKLVQSQTVAV
jgi:hypothetical protein